MATGARRLVPVSWRDVTVAAGFWGPRLATTRAVTLPLEYQQCQQTGRIDAFRLAWRDGDPNPPHIFWDSDVAKWIEAAAYSLAVQPDTALQAQLDEVIALVVAAQQPDGYLNVHFTVVEPQKRWSNLRDWHELYCAGHLMEAAVAHFTATGDRRLLDCLARYADYIGTVFGRGEGQRRGYCGHEEVELALIKLFRATGEPRYRDLAAYFIDERGAQPHYFDLEAAERDQKPLAPWYGPRHEYNQSHLPVRQQTTAEGHAVRAMYLYSGMADLAAETGDRDLLAALHALWADVTEQKMYVTGGVGSSGHGERFTSGYDLPNQTAYAETCAAIGLVFWAHRMLQLEPDRRYADVLELALYNGALSGISLDGRRFFYANPLLADPQRHQGSFAVERQEWFGCACCPPNIARLLTSLGEYVAAVGQGALWVHLFVNGEIRATVAGAPATVAVRTAYPWEGEVRLQVLAAPAAGLPLRLRIPAWAAGATLAVDGAPCPAVADASGYLTTPPLPAGATAVLTLPLLPRRVWAKPEVREDNGRVALFRGPLLYCLEELDNGPGVDQLAPVGELTAEWCPDLLGGVTVLRGQGRRRVSWSGELYRSTPPAWEEVALTAVPYALWQNRGVGQMAVWLPDAGQA
ncbi:MAG: glycoside hydrolase family 127 protein [Fimbriimonadaceae bacterium]|nr:glycoside hydrolase family 127 protein [Fimbriimonadaceae bacterium]